MPRRPLDRAQATRRAGEDRGFTLVELLVVMIIVGVLVAIAVPALLTQQARAREASAKSDLKQIAKELVGYYVDGTGGLTLSAGSSPGSWQLVDGAATVVSTGPLSQGNTVGPSSITSSDVYCLAVQPAQTGARSWHVDQDGLTAGAC